MASSSTTLPRSTGYHARSPGQIPLRGWWQILVRCWRRWGEQQLPIMVAGLTFRSLLILFPLLLAATSLTGLLTTPADVIRLLQPLSDSMPPAAWSFITDNTQRLAMLGAPQLSVALLTSVLLALWSLHNGMLALIGTYNQIYLEHEERHFLKVRGLALVLGLTVIVASLIGLATLIAIPVVLEWLHLSTLGRILAPVVGFTVLGLTFLTCQGLLCRFAVDRRPPRWHWLSVGSCISTVLWLAACALLTWFATTVSRADRLYGALSGFIILALWLQITVTALCLGALVNSEVEHQTDVDSTVGPPAPRGQRQAFVADDSVRQGGTTTDRCSAQES